MIVATELDVERRVVYYINALKRESCGV